MISLIHSPSIRVVFFGCTLEVTLIEFFPFTQTIYKNDQKVADVVPEVPVVPEQPVADPVEEVRNPEIEKLVEQLPAAVDPDAPVEGKDLSSKLIFESNVTKW